MLRQIFTSSVNIRWVQYSSSRQSLIIEMFMLTGMSVLQNKVTSL